MSTAQPEIQRKQEKKIIFGDFLALVHQISDDKDKYSEFLNMFREIYDNIR
jgi:hypothetical protein